MPIFPTFLRQIPWRWARSCGPAIMKKLVILQQADIIRDKLLKYCCARLNPRPIHRITANECENTWDARRLQLLLSGGRRLLGAVGGLAGYRKVSSHTKGNRTDDHYAHAASDLILRRRNRLPRVVLRARWRRVIDDDQQVLLHHLSLAAPFFRLPQPHFVLQDGKCA